MTPLPFDARIGGVLVAPRRTFARLAAGEARAGDVAWLLLFKLVAGELDRFARAVAVGREFGVGFAVQEVLQVLPAILPDLCGILIAGMMMRLFAPRDAPAFDLAAYAWIPYLAVELAGALVYTARGVPPSAHAHLAIQYAGVAWAVAAWVVALVEARRGGGNR